MTKLVGARRSLILPRTGNPARAANNFVTAIGDSITLAGAAATGGRITETVGGFAFSYSRMHAQLANASPVGGYLTWAAIVPKTGDSAGDGKLRWGGAHATVNLRTDQIWTTHIIGDDSPLNVRSKAGTCLIMAGSNDLAQICPSGTIVQNELNEAVVYIGKMIDALLDRGYFVALCATPPHNTANNKTALAALLPNLVSLAQRKRVLYIDTHTPVSDAAFGWGANMHQGDGIHPSVLGAKAMGLAIRDALDPYLPNAAPTLSVVATDDAANMLYKNGSFTDDGNADGVPDGGQTQSTTFWGQTANGTAWTLGARAGYDGQAMRWNKTSDPGTSQLQGSGSNPPSPLGVDGHTITWAFKAEIASWAASTQWLHECWKVADSTIKPFRLNLQTDGAFTSAIDPFVWSQEWVVPSGFDDADSGKMRPNISAAGTGTNTMDGYVGQYTLRDESV
jgi:hypothetical protein